jgi:hypothetical protein
LDVLVAKAEERSFDCVPRFRFAKETEAARDFAQDDSLMVGAASCDLC